MEDDNLYTLPRHRMIIDTYVRGAIFEAIKKGDAAVERAVKGAADMIGATATIENTPGYLSLQQSIALSEVLEHNAAALLGEDNLMHGKDIVGSTDMGDLSSILLAIQPTIGGYTGVQHSKEFCVSNPETAYVTSAKILALTAAELLYSGAEKGRAVSDSFRPRMTKVAYLNNR